MKRLIIICEGPTEQEFCNDLLSQYFFAKNILLETPTIKHSNGGIVAWETLKKQIIRHLNEGDCIVSLFVDYYRIKDSYKFPKWIESKKISNLYDRMNFLFKQMADDIEDALRPRFIPYIQLHEFEALLFSDISVFQKNFTKQELDFPILENAINSANSPEEINNGPNTAPSERLKKAIRGYDKVIYGACLASEIGLDTIRKKCMLFNQWIERLETGEQFYYKINCN